MYKSYNTEGRHSYHIMLEKNKYVWNLMG